MSKKEEATVPAKVPSPFETALARVDTPANFKAVKRLTRDVASITKLGEAVILCQGELFWSELKSQFPPHNMVNVAMINVLDCLRGEEYTLICGAVLASTFKHEGEPLEGRYFAIRSGEIPAGKRYRKVEVVALERVE